MRTTGGFVFVYPVPAFVIVIEEIVSPTPITGFAVAVTNPTDGDPTVTVAVLYPTPPSDITREETVPAALTTAVADAPTLVACETNLTFSWKVRLVLFSFLPLNRGLTLSTSVSYTHLTLPTKA